MPGSNVNLTNAGVVQAWGLTDDVLIRQLLLQSGILITGLSFVGLTRTLIVWPAPNVRWSRRWLIHGLGLLLMVLALTAVVRPPIFAEINFNSAVLLLALSTLAGLWGCWKNYPNARALTLSFLPFVLWAVFVTIARWLDTPLPDGWNRSRILMGTSLLHLTLLWLLVLSRDARLKRAKRELESRLERLQSEMASTTLFLGMLAHELDHPLRALLGLTTAEGNQAGNGPGSMEALRLRLLGISREFRDIIETCTQRLRQTTPNNLMREQVDLPELLGRITDHFQQKTNEHLLRHDVRSLPPSFFCDPRLVGILLSNLLENAVRYSEPNGVIWVRGRVIDGESIEITVEDEGSGIPEAMKERIFERYVQLPSTTCPQRGMGMGLFIVQRIAEMHCGNVVCESDPSQGTTFRVILRESPIGAV